MAESSALSEICGKNPAPHESKDRTAYQSKAAGKQNVVSLQSVQKSSKVVLSEP
ncbi:hypothetical protein MOC48_22575, partial [Bacillus haynesii]|nr:hypothetical protein [Bacillus haynesii]